MAPRAADEEKVAMVLGGGAGSTTDEETDRGRRHRRRYHCRKFNKLGPKAGSGSTGQTSQNLVVRRSIRTTPQHAITLLSPI